MLQNLDRVRSAVLMISQKIVKEWKHRHLKENYIQSLKLKRVYNIEEENLLEGKPFSFKETSSPNKFNIVKMVAFNHDNGAMPYHFSLIIICKQWRIWQFYKTGI